MENLYVKGIKRLEHNMIIVDDAAFKQLLKHVNELTDVVNTLLENVSNLQSVSSKHSAEIATNLKNIKALATALEGAYTDE